MQYVTSNQAREIDRRAIEELGIPGVVLMENAGRGAAEIILERCPHPGLGVAILCGGGNNGGDGFVIARHLVNAGHAASIILCTDARRLTGDAAVNHEIVKNMGLPMTQLDVRSVAEQLHEHGTVVDALLGTGCTGPVRPPLDAAIAAINDHGAFRVAIDVPSGLDCDSGTALGPVVHADLTITFMAPKAGFATATGRAVTGDIVVAGIGAPSWLLDESTGSM